jgi:L-lactate dehydrogenase
MKISVIGMGKVGAAAAFSLVIRAIPHELVLVARTKEKALGDALDLQHAAAMVRSMDVIAGDAADTAGSDIVILSLSVPQGPITDRLELAEPNGRLLREVVPELASLSPKAVFLVLTNPVDVCTYVTLRASGLPSGQVMGSGTLIDTARLRSLVARETGISARDIRAYVLGEHGDSQFPAMSVASVGGLRLDRGGKAMDSLVDEARHGGQRVTKQKGYTNYAVALSATLICEAIAEDARTILPVSTLIDGFQGVRDVCLSLPCVVGSGGIQRVLSVDLDAEECEQFRRSASIVREALERVGGGR